MLLKLPVSAAERRSTVSRKVEILTRKERRFFKRKSEKNRFERRATLGNCCIQCGKKIKENCSVNETNHKIESKISEKIQQQNFQKQEGKAKVKEERGK